MEDVVISGIGCRFSEGSNVQDFGRQLLANKHLVGKARWKDDVFPAVSGQVSYEVFDEVFMGINKKLAECTDPISKISCMRSFEAIVDAGLHPAALRRSKTAVYALGGISECEQRSIYAKNSVKKDGYLIMGASKAMLPNRVSYCFDLAGPSVSMDASWAGGHLGLQQAAAAIREGRSDAALVVAASLALFGESSQQLNGLGLVTAEGVTRSFDEAGTGAVRSDGVVVLLLQRADLAKRCYARVLASDAAFVGPRCELSPALPSAAGIADFLDGLYRKHGIDPRAIAYLEADGSGHRIRDACELNAVDAALVRDAERADPLPVGSVKSNIGTVDCVNALAAVCKAVVVMETGIIPATINYQQPNAGARGLLKGRLKVVDRNTPLQMSGDKVVAVNTLGVASTVGHTVLAGNPRGPSGAADPARNLPRLVTFSARTDEAAVRIAETIQNAPFDVHYYRLLQDVFSDDIKGYNYRGYTICPPPAPAAVKATVIERLEKREVWFVYSGMGSQWAGMGAALMAVPVFAETIERLHAVLEPHGADLKTILTETGPQAFDNISKAFVGITACQIALTNVLKAVGVVPDGIVGHSVGELGCAYADGCLTEEQTILATWARGCASNCAPLDKGMMAAVGLGYSAVLPLLPPTIDVACHNSSTSCTLSGPAEDVERFVKELTDKGVFARTVNASDIAYHSRYIQPAGPMLLEALKKVITEPKLRSSKWITTSIPVDQRDGELAKYCSAEYQTNNLLSPVLLEEALSSIPADAMIIEIAPHGLLQAILTRALPDNVHIPLTRRQNPDPVSYLLGAIGRMAMSSAAPKVARLYPDVEFPVPRGTPSLAELVSWKEDGPPTSVHTLIDEEIAMLMLSADIPCMKIGGSSIYPLSEELVMAWSHGTYELTERSETLSLENVIVKQWMSLPSTGGAEITAQRMPASLETQILHLAADEDVALVRARVDVSDSSEQCPTLAALGALEKDALELPREDLYGELAARGLEYAEKYTGIDSIRMGRHDWLISLADNCSLAVVIEALVQVYILRALDETQELRLPWAVRRLGVGLQRLKSPAGLKLRLNLATGVLAGEGVYVSGVQMKALQPGLRAQPQPWTRGQLVPRGPGGVRVQFIGVTALAGHAGAPCHVDYVGVQADRGARVMGVGRWQPAARAPVPDAALRWPVPERWSAEEAATVPLVYAMVYHGLVLRAAAARGESVLVTDGVSAVGQAAIRVATRLGCAPLYATAAGPRERSALLAMFPQLQHAHVLTHGDGTGSFEHGLRLLTRAKGVRLVVNTLGGAGYRAALRCLGYFGRLLNYSRDDLEDSQMGSNMFLMATAVFGCSGSELFHATEADRAQVVEAVGSGIREGVVQPIVGAEVFGAARSIGDLKAGTKVVIEVGDTRQHCDPSKSYIVVGAEALDALLLASRLAVLGARHVVAAVGTSATSPLVRQRQLALQRQLGAQLQVRQVRRWDAAAAAELLRVAERAAPVHCAVVFAKDEKDLAAAALLDDALQPDARLVLLTDRAGPGAPLAALARQREAVGRPASCLGATLAEASERLGAVLHASSITLLPSVTAEQRGVEDDIVESLTPAALAALGAGPRAGRARVVELSSRGQRAHAARETRTLFVLPPLGVLDPASGEQLGALAARLLCPVLVVETAPGDAVRAAAGAVLQAMLEHQPHGPYNLLGWRLSTVLALEVQRQLEAAGKRGVLFLVHGDVARLRHWAQQHQGAGVVDAARAGLVNGEASRADRGSQLLDLTLKAVAQHESDTTRHFAGMVRVVRATGDKLQSLGQTGQDPHVTVRTLKSHRIEDEELALYVNEHLAWSQLAGEADLSLAVDLASATVPRAKSNIDLISAQYLADKSHRLRGGQFSIVKN